MPWAHNERRLCRFLVNEGTIRAIFSTHTASVAFVTKGGEIFCGLVDQTEDFDMSSGGVKCLTYFEGAV